MSTPHNFFERQHQAKRSTTRLILLFCLGVFGMVIACNAVAILTLSFTSATAVEGEGWWLAMQQDWFWRDNGLFLGVLSLVIIVTICGGSLFKSISLASSGGSGVARSMGGSRVDPATLDRQKHRLINVVEEMAIASGMPVPEIYVMEREASINAFAAGSNPANAAIAVTQGCLDQLNRDELQGVIAHEFSHIANNDVKINLRIMGWLFGILMVAYLGQILFRSLAYGNSGRRSSREGGSIVLALFVAAGTFIAIGYIGLFFGRLIKAGISRERERLADASAVQYTRSVDGLAGALKKIGGFKHGSTIQNRNPENVSHMLFGAGSSSFKSSWFATHPPIAERIATLDPSFDGQLPHVPEQQHHQGQPQQQVNAASHVTHSFSEQTAISQLAGLVSATAIESAEQLHDQLPPTLVNAAHQPRAASALVLALLLDQNSQTVTHQQLHNIEVYFGAEFQTEVAQLGQHITTLPQAHKLPLLQIAVPSLRQQPADTQRALLNTSLELIQADNQIVLFEFCLFELLSHYLSDRRSTLTAEVATATLLRCLAFIEHPTEQRHAAYKAGIAALRQVQPAAFDDLSTQYREPQNWMDELYHALPVIATLSPYQQEALLQGVLAVMNFDGVISSAEIDLLRLLCGIMDVPLPIA